MGSNPLFKVVQRRHLKMLGGQGRTAWVGEHGPDSRPNSWLCVESKERDGLARWFTEPIDKIVAEAEKGELPVVIWHNKGSEYKDDIITMRLEDFIEWFVR